ncbi:conjugative transposon protein TraM [Mucilaginibacter paludis]|uniref:Conjugative transposon TraM protein n=1 Tax=Mucilaginibacter paludis DSM 18603 TaxID=714943 RepID=H1YI38_9SPHI|nr:conjugative transposon protein TraM [Mucilaginibacter paludis]EHQ26473.1 conjugative transposon TraM protein [Mucilaginibacter paludis DSM 18603]
MTINLKQPKYVLPMLVLPFLLLFFAVYHSSAGKKKPDVQKTNAINASVGDVAPSIKKKRLDGKLDAFRNTYKDADGLTAVNPIPTEQSGGAAYGSKYSDREKKTLDSISQAMKQKYAALAVQGKRSAKPPGGISTQDQALAKALNTLQRQRESAAYRNKTTPPPKEKDPLEIFKQQMAYMDSVGKLNDPAYKAERQKKEAETKAKAAAKQAIENTLAVSKADYASSDFNTVLPEQHPGLMTAVIDENVTGYAGSRIRLRLLEDIKAGNALVKKDTYIYALISGFSGQRVTLTIKSILYNGQLLPVKLDVYDMDGLLGLYVPSSQFRDFTKDLGTNSIQGVSIDGNSQNGSQFLMSTADKLFQSTSTAIASAIRKNKAKIKYNSYIYLIDTHAQTAQ